MAHSLSGPVLCDTARLSQRYPPIARYGVFGVSTWPIGCHTPSPCLSVSPLESMRSSGAIPPPPPQKGISAIWEGISHWAAKHTADCLKKVHALLRLCLSLPLAEFKGVSLSLHWLLYKVLATSAPRAFASLSWTYQEGTSKKFFSSRGTCHRKHPFLP